jgi:hypothetical protein
MGAIVILACYSQMTTSVGKMVPPEYQSISQEKPGEPGFEDFGEDSRADIDAGFGSGVPASLRKEC